MVEATLRRADEVEDWLHAFAWLDPQRARRLAADLDRAAQAARSEGGPLGLLHGVPIGVKDIVDTAGIPTEHGSALFAGRIPDASAEVVRNLEGAGALMLGKTVTAEMAYFHPGPTVNPFNPERTPGGLLDGVSGGRRGGDRARGGGDADERLRHPSGRVLRGGGLQAHRRAPLPARECSPSARRWTSPGPSPAP